MKVDADLVLFVRQRRWQEGRSQKAIARELAGIVGRTTIQRIDAGRYDHLVIRQLVERLPSLDPPGGVPRCSVCGFRARRVEGRCPICVARAFAAAGRGPWESPPVPEDAPPPDDAEICVDLRGEARRRYEDLRRHRP